MSDALAYLADELAELREQKLFRYPKVLTGQQQARAVFNGREVINLSSNNYLGLATHPRMIAAAAGAAQEFGAGSGAVRTIAGTMDIHVELEKKIAAFKHTEAALVFQSGFTANAGTVAAVLGKDDMIISDELNHASIIDGCRLSRATIKVFPHGDRRSFVRPKSTAPSPWWTMPTPAACSAATVGERSTTSTCMARLISRWARCRRPSACSADTWRAPGL